MPTTPVLYIAPSFGLPHYVLRGLAAHAASVASVAIPAEKNGFVMIYEPSSAEGVDIDVRVERDDVIKGITVTTLDELLVEAVRARVKAMQ